MFFRHPGFLFGIALVAFLGIRPFVPPPSFDSGVKYEQAVIDGKKQTVRVIPGSKMIQYRGPNGWDDVHVDMSSIFKRGGRIVVFAMPISGPWTIDDAKPEDAALWRHFFSS